MSARRASPAGKEARYIVSLSALTTKKTAGQPKMISSATRSFANEYEQCRHNPTAKGSEHDRDNRVGVKHRHVLGLPPIAPIKRPANEECQEADKEHDGRQAEPLAQQVARLGAQMRRAAFDESYAAAGLRRGARRCSILSLNQSAAAVR